MTFTSSTDNVWQQSPNYVRAICSKSETFAPTSNLSKVSPEIGKLPTFRGFHAKLFPQHQRIRIKCPPMRRPPFRPAPTFSFSLGFFLFPTAPRSPGAGNACRGMRIRTDERKEGRTIAEEEATSFHPSSKERKFSIPADGMYDPLRPTPLLPRERSLLSFARPVETDVVVAKIACPPFSAVSRLPDPAKQPSFIAPRVPCI